jgi:uncharacterized repeat protein (TIGR01451 family)
VPSPDIGLKSRAGRLLTEVGDTLRYTVVVSNPGSEPLDDVVVVDLVPSEVDVEGVSLVDGVEAVQIGEHKGQEDIVWVLAPIAPEESIKLPWTGHAARPGDLTATNAVEARISDERVRVVKSRSFLAMEQAMGVENPAYRRVASRVVTQRVPAPAVLGAPVIPATGAGLDRLTLAAIGLMIAGLSLTGAARGSRRSLSIGIVVLSLVAVACTTSDPEVQAPSGAPSDRRSESPEAEATPDREGERVLGERLERDRRRDERDAPPTDVAAPEPAQVPAPVPQRFEVVETERLVVVRAGDLPARVLASQAGGNVLSYVFDADSEEIREARSERLVTAEAATEILSAVSLSNGAIESTGTIRNPSERSRLRVHGRILLAIFAEDELLARLRSDEIDATLTPNGEVVVPFTHLLPTGEYRVEISFEATAQS